MKTLLSYALLLTVFILNSGAGCGAKNEDAVPKPAYLQSLLGRWEVVEATVYSQDPGQAERKLGSFRTGLAYIFYDNNSYDGCIQSGSDWDNAGQSGAVGMWKCSTDKSGRWTLKVGNASKQNGILDEDSFITLTAPTLKAPQVYKFYYMDDKSLVLGLTPTKDAFGTETWMSIKLEKK